MNLSCLECVNKDVAMSSPPPPTNPRSDSPDNVNDGIMPIPFHHCATLNGICPDSDEASLSSRSFLDMIFYFFDDVLSRVSGKRTQSDQEDETTPMPHSVSFLDTQTGISPLPSPGPPSRTQNSSAAVPKDRLDAPTFDKKAKKVKSSVAHADSPVKTKASPSQSKVAGEDLSSRFLSTIASGESVSPLMTDGSVPPPPDDVDKYLAEFLSFTMVTPATSELEMRDDVPGVVDTTPDSQGGRPKRIDWDSNMDQGMESFFLDPPQAETVPDTITKAPVPALQNDEPHGTMMQDRFSPSKKNPIIISKQDVTDADVLCGRETRGLKHPGNVVYRNAVGKKRRIYQSFAKRKNKTDMSTSIMDKTIKGRFLTKHNGKQYKVMTSAEARKKVSQSLRENPGRKK